MVRNLRQPNPLYPRPMRRWLYNTLPRELSFTSSASSRYTGAPSVSTSREKTMSPPRLRNRPRRDCPSSSWLAVGSAGMVAAALRRFGIQRWGIQDRRCCH